MRYLFTSWLVFLSYCVFSQPPQTSGATIYEIVGTVQEINSKQQLIDALLSKYRSLSRSDKKELNFNSLDSLFLETKENFLFFVASFDRYLLENSESHSEVISLSQGIEILASHIEFFNNVDDSLIVNKDAVRREALIMNAILSDEREDSNPFYTLKSYPDVEEVLNLLRYKTDLLLKSDMPVSDFRALKYTVDLKNLREVLELRRTKLSMKIYTSQSEISRLLDVKGYR